MKDLFALEIRSLSPAWPFRSAGPAPQPGSSFNFASYDCLAVGGGEYKLVPRRPRKMVPISYAAKVKGISVQTIHNYIVADFIKTVERPTPFKWLIDLGELDHLLSQSTDMEFWTPERTAAYLKAKRGRRRPVPAKQPKAFRTKSKPRRP